jgi:hypothetical protein
MIGIGAAWVAVYALALNVILSSALHAAVSPLNFAAQHVLCANSAEIGVVRDDAGKADKKSAGCPLCVGTHASALPPPASPTVARRPSQTATVMALDSVLVALARISDQRARGPPGPI